eukprot:m.434004 g.434004  ORF g.434004 m.434004 type:complete len:774 (+) comp17653_c0_seq1:109-2430(+)
MKVATSGVFTFAASKAERTMGNAQVAKEAPTARANPDDLPNYEGQSPPFYINDVTSERPIFYTKSGLASEEVSPATTVGALFKRAVDKRGDKFALRIEAGLPEPDGKDVPPALPLEQWKSWTWAEYYADATRVAKALIHLGMEPHDRVSIFGFNSPEWFLSEVGAIIGGGVAVGIYPTDTPEQIGFKLRHSGAKVVIMEDASKHARVAQAVKECPDVIAVVTWACKGADMEGPNGKSIKCYTWNELLELAPNTPDSVVEERLAAQRPGHCCALIYTSGTTGDPKAVMISHDNILFDALSASSGMPEVCATATEERILSYLPLSHVAGMMVDVVMPIVTTATRPGWVCAFFARAYDIKLGSVVQRTNAVKPTMFLGVPRVWEKLAEKLKAIGAATKPGLAKSIAGWAKSTSLAHMQECQMGRSGYVPFGHSLANVVLTKIKVKLGLDQCKFAFTGAAPISFETLSYWGSLGLQINEVYGMSENTGGGTWSKNDTHVWGSCGYQVPGTEVKIFQCEDGDINKKIECPPAKELDAATEEEQGEVCMRGRHIMLGYMGNPALGEEHMRMIEKKNSEAIDNEGWLHSGDKGAKDARGMVKITGRFKELIIGAGGENIAPVPIEDNIKLLCPAISNCVMIGDKRKFCTALVTLKTTDTGNGELPGSDTLEGPAATAIEGVTTVSEAARNPKFIEMIQTAIEHTNKNGKVCPLRPAQVQKFTILPHDLSMSGGELTPTFKTKRSVISAKYVANIDAMYDSKEVYVPSPFPDASAAAAAPQ